MCVYKFAFVVHKEYNFDYIIHHTLWGVQVAVVNIIFMFTCFLFFCTATHLLSFFLIKESLLYFFKISYIFNITYYT